MCVLIGTSSRFTVDFTHVPMVDATHVSIAPLDLDGIRTSFDYFAFMVLAFRERIGRNNAANPQFLGLF
ncbi:MAG: hypothetical protein V3V68_04960 [Nitrosomonadaceae bacterium]